MDFKAFLKDFFIPKLKFAITSGIATAVDYAIYISLTYFLVTSETVAHGISYTCGMILNFILQKRYIFITKRKLGYVFTLSVIFSLIGWMLSQSLFNFFIHYIEFFKSYDLVAKILVTGIIFLYNFYTKRFSFEKRVPMDKMKDYFK